MKKQIQKLKALWTSLTPLILAYVAHADPDKSIIGDNATVQFEEEDEWQQDNELTRLSEENTTLRSDLARTQRNESQLRALLHATNMREAEIRRQKEYLQMRDSEHRRFMMLTTEHLQDLKTFLEDIAQRSEAPEITQIRDGVLGALATIARFADNLRDLEQRHPAEHEATMPQYIYTEDGSALEIEPAD